MTEQKYRLLMVAILHEEREGKRGEESYARQLTIVFNCWKLTLLCRIVKWIRRTRNYEDTITSWTQQDENACLQRVSWSRLAPCLCLSLSLPPPPCHSNHLQCGWLPRIASHRERREICWKLPEFGLLFLCFSHTSYPLFPTLCSPCVVVTSLGTLSLPLSPSLFLSL